MTDALASVVDFVILSGRIFFGTIQMLGLVALVGILGFFIDVGE